MRRVCIIGHAADKFTDITRFRAETLIGNILLDAEERHGFGEVTLVSGRSPMGGIDVWAEEAADRMGFRKSIFEPTVNQWDPYASYGFKKRNLDLAKNGDEFHVVVVEEYPPGYWERPGAKPPKEEVMRDGKPWCYHCRGARPVHVKSGACWTALQAMKAGKPAEWRIIA